MKIWFDLFLPVSWNYLVEGPQILFWNLLSQYGQSHHWHPFCFHFLLLPLLQKLAFIQHHLGWLHPSPRASALICQHGFWLIRQHDFISLESATGDLLVQFDPVTPSQCTSQVSLLMLLLTYLWHSKHELPKVCSHVLFMIAFYFLFP